MTATQAATGISSKTTTGGQGNCLPHLPPSIYNITATRAGFEAYTEKGVMRADAGGDGEHDAETRQTSETVTVTAETAQVDVTTGTLSQVIGQRR